MDLDIGDEQNLNNQTQTNHSNNQMTQNSQDNHVDIEIEDQIQDSNTQYNNFTLQND